MTAHVKRTRASVQLSASANIDLSGNPLSGAGLVAVQLPVELSATVDIQQKYGVQLLGCKHLGSDSYDVSGKLSTVGRIWVFFALAPSLRTDVNGDYVLTIKPITDVMVKLQDTEIKNTHTSGVSPFSSIAVFVLALPSTGLKALTDILRGNSLSSVWDNLWAQFPKDLAMGLALSIPEPVMNEVLPVVAKVVVANKLKGIDSKYSPQLKTRLEAAVAKALDLDAHGERYFVIRKDFMQLVAQFGPAADIWLQTKRPGYCASDVECDDGRYCNGVEHCVSEQCVAGKEPCERSTNVDEQYTCVESKKQCLFRMTCGGSTGKICRRLSG